MPEAASADPPDLTFSHCDLCGGCDTMISCEGGCMRSICRDCLNREVWAVSRPPPDAYRGQSPYDYVAMLPHFICRQCRERERRCWFCNGKGGLPNGEKLQRCAFHGCNIYFHQTCYSRLSKLRYVRSARSGPREGRGSSPVCPMHHCCCKQRARIPEELTLGGKVGGQVYTGPKSEQGQVEGEYARVHVVVCYNCLQAFHKSCMGDGDRLAKSFFFEATHYLGEGYINGCVCGACISLLGLEAVGPCSPRHDRTVFLQRYFEARAAQTFSARRFATDLLARYPVFVGVSWFATLMETEGEREKILAASFSPDYGSIDIGALLDDQVFKGLCRLPQEDMLGGLGGAGGAGSLGGAGGAEFPGGLGSFNSLGGLRSLSGVGADGSSSARGSASSSGSPGSPSSPGPFGLLQFATPFVDFASALEKSCRVLRAHLKERAAPRGTTVMRSAASQEPRAEPASHPAQPVQQELEPPVKRALEIQPGREVQAAAAVPSLQALRPSQPGQSSGNGKAAGAAAGSANTQDDGESRDRRDVQAPQASQPVQSLLNSQGAAFPQGSQVSRASQTMQAVQTTRTLKGGQLAALSAPSSSVSSTRCSYPTQTVAAPFRPLGSAEAVGAQGVPASSSVSGDSTAAAMTSTVSAPSSTAAKSAASAAVPVMPGSAIPAEASDAAAAQQQKPSLSQAIPPAPSSAAVYRNVLELMETMSRSFTAQIEALRSDVARLSSWRPGGCPCGYFPPGTSQGAQPYGTPSDPCWHGTNLKVYVSNGVWACSSGDVYPTLDMRRYRETECYAVSRTRLSGLAGTFLPASRRWGHLVI